MGSYFTLSAFSSDRGLEYLCSPCSSTCRALLLRSQASTAEVRALHGLCKELEGRQQQEAAPAAAASAPSQQHQQQGQH